MIEKERPSAAMKEAAMAERMPLAAVAFPVKRKGRCNGPSAWSSQSKKSACSGPPREISPGTNQKPFNRFHQRAWIAFSSLLNTLSSFDLTDLLENSTIFFPHRMQAETRLPAPRKTDF